MSISPDAWELFLERFRKLEKRVSRIEETVAASNGTTKIVIEVIKALGAVGIALVALFK